MAIITNVKCSQKQQLLVPKKYYGQQKGMTHKTKHHYLNRNGMYDVQMFTKDIFPSMIY